MAAAGLLAAAILFLVVALPAKPVRLSLDHIDPSLRARTVAGAYHIHTNRSDGAAARAFTTSRHAVLRTPASAASAAALSVFSQVNSGSVRPK